MSPRKVRRVIDLVRGKEVDAAINMLHFTRKRAALPIEKTLRSAVANMVNNPGSKKVTPENLYVKTAFVDSGFTMKRFRAGSMGRASRIRKRTCHITIVVSEYEDSAPSKS
jgi:large subunit ribosomal protein L22